MSKETAEDAGSLATSTERGHPYFVPTFSLIAYLLTILAWELELGNLLLRALTKEKLDPIGSFALLIVTGSLTLFSWFLGKKEFQRLRSTRGRIPITAFQGVIVTITVFAFGGILTWIAVRIFDL